MSLRRVVQQRWKWLLVIVPVAALAVVLGGTYVYIHFIAPDPAPRLTFTSPASSASSSASSSSSGSASGVTSGSIDGTWTATSGTEAGYRVKEVLAGQDNEATGRTTAVTGQLVISGKTVSTASITVDMTKVASAESQRDGQFRSRIMQTSQFPTATFELKTPITLDSIPADLVQVNVKASGTLTLHGTAKDVTIDLAARRNGANLEVNGTVPITFSDYKIANPSGGPASVGDSGEMEFLVVFTR
jgi:polyisoprenoid-binding protein YceI